MIFVAVIEVVSSCTMLYQDSPRIHRSRDQWKPKTPFAAPLAAQRSRAQRAVCGDWPHWPVWEPYTEKDTDNFIPFGWKHQKRKDAHFEEMAHFVGFEWIWQILSSIFDLLFVELQVWRNVSGGAGAFTSRRLALCLSFEGVLNIRAAAVCIRMCSGSTSS